MSVPTLRRITAIALFVLTLSTVEAAPAGAAGTGYVRLAHLSPDTPAVDVYLSSPSGAITEQRFDGVGYGVVSDYNRLPTGTYAVAMRTAGSPPASPPVLTTQVTVTDGKAYTVAGVGRFADLGLRVIEDDLSLPPDGKAKIRIIQASVRAPVLSVSTSTGESIASDVPFATTTPYRLVTPGRWTVNLQPAGGGEPSSVQATCNPGNVYSLIVLDGTAGLKAELRVDARRQGGIPVGAVETGAGGVAARENPLPVLGLAGSLLVLAWAGTLAVARVRRPRRP